ncbi:MAG: 50S ribosomal protein L29 [Alphaproteobacteria bacterium]|nr:50S ribosomal protein L29 [Alphaproteobacteria bacterium]
MKIDEIRTKSVEELQGQIEDLKRESMNLRFQKATHELAKVSRIKEVRRTIARILTIIREKQIKAAGGNHA